MLKKLSSSILARLLLVNLIVLLVPWAGIEFARIFERQLLVSLERDMRNQAVLVREFAAESFGREARLDSPRLMRLLTRAARTTRTRIRILDHEGSTVLDSHAWGAPEGPEPPAPSLVPSSVYEVSSDVRRAAERRGATLEWAALADVRWQSIPARREVRDALEGRPSSYTRVRDEHPSVLLFVTEPIRRAGRVRGVVYVTRSTQPVLEELYKVRAALMIAMGMAVLVTALLTLLLAFSISRPLTRLARAARRITAGERDVAIPIDGSGEVRDLSTALATMTEQLDRRLRYISEFAADVAHEFKSPLTSIRGAAELLGEGAADDPGIRDRFLRNILLDTERLDRLVSRLLELSRLEASREPMTDVDLRDVIARVVARTHTSEQPVRVELPGAIPVLRGRAADLERALLNLVENAIRFSPPGVPVRMAIECLPDALHVVVSDEGPGVPIEHRAKIFERFFTTDIERHGTGLGLSIVRTVAEAHGGRAYLDERPHPDPGARFVLALPRSAEARTGGRVAP